MKLVDFDINNLTSESASMNVLHDDPIILRIKQDIDEEINELSNALAGGCASSYEHYKTMVGMVSAYRKSKLIIDDVLKNYTNDDE